MASLYKQSVPQLIKYLNNFSQILQKGATFAQEKSMKPETLIQYRLVPDMRGLDFQVQSCCNTAVWFVDRVGKLEHVAVEDNEQTFEQLNGRLERTIEYLKKVDPAVIDNNAENSVVMQTGRGKFGFDSANMYLSEFVIPNFHFHLTTGYCLLRTQNVPLGALDYMKDVFVKAD